MQPKKFSPMKLSAVLVLLAIFPLSIVLASKRQPGKNNSVLSLMFVLDNSACELRSFSFEDKTFMFKRELDGNSFGVPE